MIRLSAGTSIWRTSAALNFVTGRAAVPGTPSSTNRTFVGRAVSTLHRPTERTVVPSPSVTVAVVRWWVIIAVGRRPRQVILRRARVCQTRLRQGSQQPRVLNKKGDEMCTTFSGLDLSPAARSHVTVTQHTSRISLGADRNNHSTGRTGGSKGPLRLGATWPRRRRDVEGLFAICNSIPSM